MRNSEIKKLLQKIRKDLVVPNQIEKIDMILEEFEERKEENVLAAVGISAIFGGVIVWAILGLIK